MIGVRSQNERKHNNISTNGIASFTPYIRKHTLSQNSIQTLERPDLDVCLIVGMTEN